MTMARRSQGVLEVLRNSGQSDDEVRQENFITIEHGKEERFFILAG